MSFKNSIRFISIWLPLIILGSFIFLTFRPINHLKTIGYKLSKNISVESKKLIQSNDPAAGQKLIQNSIKILKRIPIDEEPLLFTAYGNYLKDSKKININLLKKAHQRNPRNRTVLQALLFNSQSQGNISETAEFSSKLYLLSPKNQEKYLAILSDVFDTVDGPSIINEYIKNNIEWSFSLINNKILLLKTEDIEDVNSSIHIFLKETSLSDWHRNHIIEKYAMRLIKIGAPNYALNFWLKNSDELTSDYYSELLGVYNPNFFKLTDTPPFNWEMYNNKSVTTEYNKKGGFFTSFRGSTSAPIARQYMRWQNNESVQLKIESLHKYNKNKGKFSIEIRCAKSHKLITNFDINSSSNLGEVKSYKLNIVPQLCDFVYLQIKAHPGIYSAPISMTVKYLNIESKT